MPRMPPSLASRGVGEPSIVFAAIIEGGSLDADSFTATQSLMDAIKRCIGTVGETQTKALLLSYLNTSFPTTGRLIWLDDANEPEQVQLTEADEWFAPVLKMFPSIQPPPSDNHVG